MAIDIFSIQPHQVSRTLRGYSVFFYGEAKSGKTTTASKFPKSLLAAFEKGYNALPGVKAQPINNWSEFKALVRQLKDERAKTLYETIIIDTADIAYDYCSKFVCNNNGVDSIGDIPYGKGYTLVADEFDSTLRSIVMMGYGIVIISHATDKTFKDESGQEYNKIVPTLDKRANNIVARMCDIIGYSRVVSVPTDNDQTEDKTMLFMRGTQRYEAGSRFKYTPDYIEFSYKNLVNAIGDAIDKQASEDGEEFFTDEVETSNLDTTSNLDYDELMNEFNSIIAKLAEDETKMEEFYAPRIKSIVESVLGKGNQIGNATRDQVESISIIVDELKTLVAQQS